MRREYRAPHLPADERIAEALEKLTKLTSWIMALLTLITIAVLFK
jgi:hypothetical protein